MGFGDVFSSQSDTKTDLRFFDQKIAATEGSQVNAPRAAAGKGRLAQANGGLAIQGNGNQIALSATDFGAIDTAKQLIGQAIGEQANITGNLVKQFSDLATTQLTGGANLSQHTTLVALIVLGALSAVFYFSTHR